MTPKYCPVCGETWFEGLDRCEACGHPYPDPDDPAWAGLIEDDDNDDVE